MKLWTWQPADFDPSTNRIDRSRSEFVRNSTNTDLLRAYEELDALLTLPEEMKHQYVWCFTAESQCQCAWPGRTLRHLEVPEDAILAFIDGPVWERLTGNQTVPEYLRTEWEQELRSRKIFGDSRDKEMAKRKQDYLAACPPRNECLQTLRLPTKEGRDTAALVRAPLCPTWIRG